MQRFFQGVIFLTALSVCSAQEVENNEASLAFERKELLKVAHRLEKSLNELRALEKVKAVQSGLADLQFRQRPQGGAMDKIIAIHDWEGPLETLLEVIAKKYHYKFSIIGKKPAVPILVSISTQDKTVGTVIQDADLQAGMRAHILVDHSMGHTIELRYVSEAA